MSVLGCVLFVLMGFTLGLLGGGGSILSVPILVYIFELSPVDATSHSLFIVGVAAIVGTYRNIVKGNIDYISALTLSLPGILGVSIARRILIPSLPETIFELGTMSLHKGNFILICFAALMITASYSMYFGRKNANTQQKKSLITKLLIGLIIGVITGFVGAGGGFIIVPVLIFILGLETKRAIGTSLLVISINSLIGFSVSAIGGAENINLTLLLTLSAIGSVGILIGIYFSKFVPAQNLKKIFGIFVFILGLWIISKQLN